MDYKETYAIKRNFQLLLRECSSRSLVDNLLDRMFSNDLLENDEYEILIRMTLGKEKMRTLVSLMIDKRGRKYNDLYAIFIEGLKDDLERVDIVEKLSEMHQRAPKVESDRMSIMNEELHSSLTSLDSGHSTHPNTTYTYNNYFYSCPAIPSATDSVVSKLQSTDGSMRRKLSLDNGTSGLLGDSIDAGRLGVRHVIVMEENSSHDENDAESLTSLTETETLRDPRQTEDYDKLYRIAIIGSRGVGKTSLVSWFSSEHVIEVNAYKVKLQTEDLTHLNITKSSLNCVNGIVVVYDVTNMESLLDVITWYESVQRLACNATILALVGNKSDLASRTVSHEQGKSMASHLGIPAFVETSYKRNLNVDQVFTSIVTQITTWISEPQKSASTKDYNHRKRRKRKILIIKRKGCILM